MKKLLSLLLLLISGACFAGDNFNILDKTAPTIAGGTINNAVIGGTTPAAGTFTSITGTANTAALPAAPAGSLFQLGNADGTATRGTFDAFATSSSLAFRRADTTAANPSAIQSGETIGGLGAFAYGTTGYATTSRASINFLADETWTDANQGTNANVMVTPDLSTTSAISFRFLSSGGINIGATKLTSGGPSINMNTTAATASAPGAAGGKIEFRCGTNAGTLKVIAYAGTSATGVTMTDNIGAGVTGC